MSNHVGNSLNMDGLVVYLDANNTKSYDDTAAEWYDISGNKGTFYIIGGDYIYNTDSPKSIELNQPGGFPSLQPTPPSLQGDPNFTVCGFFRAESDFIHSSLWGIGSGDSKLAINTYNGSGNNRITIDLWGVANIYSNRTLQLGDWTFVSWRKIAGLFSRDNVIINYNDEKITGTDLTLISGLETIVPDLGPGGVGIANTHGGLESVHPHVSYSQFMIYDRVLSDSEVNDIYYSNKYKYGIE